MILMSAVAVAIVTWTPTGPPHSVDFWRGVVQQQYALPEGADVAALADELGELLASPDPELRDEIAYSTLTAWIYQKPIIEPDLLRRLTDRWLENLRVGVGERDADGVFRRSFSALMLSVVVAQDNAHAFLTAQELGRIEASALGYLTAERDVRGYDPTKGWAHSAAHTADLLKFVARSRHLAPADQPRVLDAIATKLVTTPTVFINGEDERLARAILSIVNRGDFDREAFGAWTTRARPAPVRSRRPTVAELNGAQNVKNLFAKLEVLLSFDPQPTEAAQFARDRVRAALKDVF